MALTAGARLGPYEIVSALGLGGMGEVYRATDTKLKRQVAIKILPSLLAGDPDRLARFQREAEVLASLNHPHIAAIYGLEEAAGFKALVMELVAGEDLAERITRGPIPLDEALPIATQIAAALEAAHEQGIMHRDLKPANIKVRPDGTAKVLDFGLAKALGPSAASGIGDNMSPTRSLHATQAGLILGTAAYMSPEQARGEAVDARADIWAFGVVLFEMLASRRPFGGDGVTETLAGILKSEPAWHLLPKETPPAVHRLLRRCLQKDSRRRLHHIADSRLDLEDAQAPTSGDALPAAVRAPHRERLFWGAAVAIAAIFGAAALKWLTPDVPEAAEMRVEITTPGAAASPSHFAMAPSGQAVVFAAGGPRGRQLWLHSLNGLPPRPLPDTEGAEYPFWSPDSKSIGYFARNKLKRVDIDGGRPRDLASVFTPAGGTWGGDDTILYVPNENGGVFRVTQKGDAQELTPRRSPPLATRLPEFLPDRQHFLFYVAGGGEPEGVYLGALGSPAIRRILPAGGPAHYGSRHLWFIRDGSLFAQMFDLSTLVLSGPVRRVTEDVAVGAFSTSMAGPIAYRPRTDELSTRQLVWWNRSGIKLRTAGDAGMLISNPSVSRDGGQVVVQRTLEQNTDIWALNRTRDVFDRVTTDAGSDSLPVLSPHGDRVVFSRTSGGSPSLAIARVDQTSPPEALPVPSAGAVRVACDWSSDGQFLLYKQLDPATGSSDLWAVPMSGNRPPLAVATGPADERDGQFSPDGNWIAFESDHEGRPEIYIQPFPGPGRKYRVSVNGGTQARWRSTGTELFYIAPDEHLMVVAIDASAGPSALPKPERLFMTHVAPIKSISRQQYVVSPDGQQFLVVTADLPPPPPLMLILNWKADRNVLLNDIAR